MPDNSIIISMCLSCFAIGFSLSNIINRFIINFWEGEAKFYKKELSAAKSEKRDSES